MLQTLAGKVTINEMDICDGSAPDCIAHCQGNCSADMLCAAFEWNSAQMTCRHVNANNATTDAQKRSLIANLVSALDADQG
jgi:hypothetical protein